MARKISVPKPTIYKAPKVKVGTVKVPKISVKAPKGKMMSSKMKTPKALTFRKTKY